MTEEFPDGEPVPASTSEHEPGATGPGAEPHRGVEFVWPAAAYEAVSTGPAAGEAGDFTLTPAGGRGESAREAVDAVNALGARLERRLDELQNLFDREIRAESTREKVVDRLHAELQEYKQDLLLNTLRPVFIDLIQLHDDIGKVSPLGAGGGGDGSGEAKRLDDLLKGFQQGIEDILYRQGVEPFQVEGDAFDPRRQRAVATVATDDPALGKTVAARHRNGFRAGDRVIRAEIVSVFAPRR